MMFNKNSSNPFCMANIKSFQILDSSFEKQGVQDQQSSKVCHEIENDYWQFQEFLSIQWILIHSIKMITFKSHSINHFFEKVFILVWKLLNDCSKCLCSSDYLLSISFLLIFLLRNFGIIIITDNNIAFSFLHILLLIWLWFDCSLSSL
jgi:hypothetical protein